AALPQPTVDLDFKFRTGIPQTTRIEVGREVYLPAEYQAPTIIVGPNGIPSGVVPATPSRFVKRNIGTTSETTSTVNPDGSITLDINQEHTEFEGFINYGSAILPAGNVGFVPVNGQVTNPTFFNPFINTGDILMPIISTTRISTSVVIRPRVSKGVVTVDMMPRLTVASPEEGAEDLTVDLREIVEQVEIPQGGVGRVYGFTRAGEDFNRQFFGAKDPTQGRVAIEASATVTAPAAIPKGPDSSAPVGDLEEPN
ncbi:MAG: hypothetical protein AAF236_09750, partial [Verrucomicrobiota bacterium]